MLALPPLSPERAAQTWPSGARRFGPALPSAAAGPGFPAAAGPAFPAAGTGSAPESAVTPGCGITRRVPSGSTTACSTTAAGTSAGQYTPYALSALGGVVV